MALTWQNVMRVEWRRMTRTWRRNRGAKILTLLLFALIGYGVLSVLYTQSAFFLRFLIRDTTLQQILSIYLFEFFVLILFFLMLFSSLMHVVFSYFFRKQDTWVMASPQFALIPWYSAAREFLYALWPLLVIGAPFLLAVQHVFDIGGASMLAIALMFLLLVWLSVMLVNIIFILTGTLYAHLVRYFQKNMSARVFVFLLSMFFLLASVGVWNIVIPRDFVAYLGDIKQHALSEDIAPITSHFRWSPSHLVAMGLFDVSLHRDNLQQEFLVLILLVIGFTLMFGLALRFFLPFWQSLQEGRFVAETGSLKDRRPGQARQSIFWKLCSPLLAREIIVFSRNGRNVIWLGFIGSLWLVQLLVNTRLESTIARYALRVENITLLELTMQLTVLLLFVTALTLRFVLPAFSLEHRYSSVLAAYPVAFSSLLRSKALLYGSGIALLSLISVAANVFIFHLAWPVILLYLFVVILSVFFLTGLALLLGILYPNFQIEDASELSTSVPGLTLTFTALLYGFLLIMACREVFIHGSYLQLAAVVLLAVGVIFLLYRKMGKRGTAYFFEQKAD